jgi:biopolymer transport protein ExbD
MAEINTSPKSPHQGKVRCKKSSLKIDMTPMVDLAFLLLTFFILTTTLNDAYIMQMQMPDEQQPGDPAPPSINAKRVLTLVLGGENKVYYYSGLTDPLVNETNYSSGGLRKVLIKKISEVKNLVVLVKPTDESNYANLVDTLDEIDISGVPHFYVTPVTQTDKMLVAERKLRVKS